MLLHLCKIIIWLFIQESTSDLSPQTSPGLNFSEPLFSDDEHPTHLTWDISPIKRLHSGSDPDDEPPSKQILTSTQYPSQHEVSITQASDTVSSLSTSIAISGKWPVEFTYWNSHIIVKKTSFHSCNII